MNLKIDDDKCFQYSATVASTYNEIDYNPERVSNIVLFKSKYNWHEINYSSKLDDWKRFEKINPTVALNILYVKEKEIFQAYISNNNSTWEKQTILLMISNEESEKKMLALSCSKKNICIITLKKTSNHKGDFYCLNCLSSFKKWKQTQIS